MRGMLGTQSHVRLTLPQLASQAHRLVEGDPANSSQDWENHDTDRRHEVHHQIEGPAGLKTLGGRCTRLRVSKHRLPPVGPMKGHPGMATHDMLIPILGGRIRVGAPFAFQRASLHPLPIQALDEYLGRPDMADHRDLGFLSDQNGDACLSTSSSL